MISNRKKSASTTLSTQNNILRFYKIIYPPPPEKIKHPKKRFTPSSFQKIFPSPPREASQISANYKYKHPSFLFLYLALFFHSFISLFCGRGDAIQETKTYEGIFYIVVLINHEDIFFFIACHYIFAGFFYEHLMFVCI